MKNNKLINDKANKLKWQSVMYYLLLGIALLALVFYWYRDLPYIARSFNDDLSTWKIWHELSFTEFVFSTKFNKIRPIAYFFISLSNLLVGAKPYLLTYILRIMQAFIALCIAVLGTRISQSRFLGACAAVCYAVSYLGYYTVMQQFGIMEGLALLFSVLMLYMLFRYINSAKEQKKYFYSAACLYLLALFTHERYLVLYPMFIIAYLLKHGRYALNPQKLKQLVLPTLFFVFQMLLRVMMFGSRFLDGTGGQPIQKTFSISSCFANLLNCISIMFGAHLGENYLEIINFASLPKANRLLVLLSAILVILSLLAFITVLWQDKNRRGAIVKNVFLIVCFMGAMLVSAAVTFRVELRWVYAPYTALLLLYIYIIGEFWRHNSRLTALAPLCMCAYMVLCAPTQYLMNKNIANLYFVGDTIVGGRLYNDIIAKEGSDIWGKRLLVVGYGASMIDTQKNASFVEQFRNDTSLEMPVIISADTLDDVMRYEQKPDVDAMYVWNEEKQVYEAFGKKDFNELFMDKSKNTNTIETTYIGTGWGEKTAQGYYPIKAAARNYFIAPGAQRLHIKAGVPKENIGKTLQIYLNKQAPIEIILDKEEINLNVDLAPEANFLPDENIKTTLKVDNAADIDIALYIYELELI